MFLIAFSIQQADTGFSLAEAYSAHAGTVGILPFPRSRPYRSEMTLPIERVRELADPTKCGPDVVSLAHAGELPASPRPAEDAIGDWD